MSKRYCYDFPCHLLIYTASKAELKFDESLDVFCKQEQAESFSIVLMKIEKSQTKDRTRNKKVLEHTYSSGKLE